MPRPLYEALVTHRDRQPVAMHVPGHKQGRLFPKDVDCAFGQIGRFDLTEISGLDDLHAPEEAIAEAQQLLTELYKTKQSYFLVNGSTVGNLAMILATCREGDIILVQRNCHKSVMNAVQLAKAIPVFLAPEWDDEGKVATYVSRETLQSALENYPTTKALVLTYPTYYGMTGPLQQMIELAHQHDVTVLVDEAHGAHFIIGEPFPQSSLSFGADIVIHSAHKTLPAFTMGAYLHVNSERVQRRKVEHYLALLQSSSPSYLIMASLDIARDYVATWTETEQLIAEITSFKRIVNEHPLVTTYECEGQDPLKVMVRVKGHSGFMVKEKLEQHHVYVELADEHQALLVLPLGVTNLNDCGRTIRDMIDWTVEQSDVLTEEMTIQYGLSSLAAPYVAGELTERKTLQLSESIGFIAAETVIPYPPGIPLIMEGERIERWHIAQTERLIASGARFQGSRTVQQQMIEIYEEK